MLILWQYLGFEAKKKKHNNKMNVSAWQDDDGKYVKSFIIIMLNVQIN